MRSAPPESPVRSWLLLGLLLLLLVPLQVLLTATTPDMNVDGGYYLDVAMHVRDGHGLVSDVSLYHAGFPHFPYPSAIYPLWPTLLGMLGRLVEITWLAHWLPMALWTASLVFAYLFGRALFPGPLGPVRGLNGGHLLAFMLGVQREYSRFSTMPYTEGLAFALLMAMLWRLAGMRARLRDGLELGLWLTLLCLCRSQLFIAPIAVGMALGLVALLGGREGRRWLAPGAAALAVVGLALFAWWQNSRAFVVDASPLTLLRFDQAQASTVLSPIDVIKDTRGPVDLVVDRLGGVALAWSLTDWDRSYARGFFAQHFALPVGLLFLLFDLRRLRLDAVRAWLTRPQTFAWLTILLLALGALATVHLPHKDGFDDWYFRRRHAIICILPFFLALAWLARHRLPLARVAALAIVLITGGFAVDSLYWRTTRALEPATQDRDAELADWLQDRASEDQPLVVALFAFKPPELAWRTDHVGYHWFYERTQLEDLRRMFDDLGTDILLFADKPTRDWAFRADPDAFRALFVPTAGPSGLRAYRRRGGPPSPGIVPSKKGNEPGG